MDWITVFVVGSMMLTEFDWLLSSTKSPLKGSKIGLPGPLPTGMLAMAVSVLPSITVTLPVELPPGT